MQLQLVSVVAVVVDTDLYTSNATITHDIQDHSSAKRSWSRLPDPDNFRHSAIGLVGSPSKGSPRPRSSLERRHGPFLCQPKLTSQARHRENSMTIDDQHTSGRQHMYVH